jgi:ribonuclease Z
MTRDLAEFHAHGVRIAGYSLAGEETFVLLPEMNVAFDVGRARRELLAIDHVFLSHGHMDHAAGVAYYFSQRVFLDNPPGNLYLAAHLERPVRDLLRVWADIDGHEPPANIHVVQPGQEVALRRDLVVRPFEVNHPCRRHDRRVYPSLGFCAIEVRQKLREEFADRTGPQIVELKRRGVEITRRVELPLVAYCGDTAAGAFLEHAYVRSSRVLLLECTFYEPDHQSRARQGFHMHVRDLRDVVSRLDCEHVLLMHLSRRTSLADARAHVQRELGPELSERVSFLMQHRRRRTTPNPPGGLPEP